MVTKAEALELVSEQLRQMGTSENSFVVVEKNTVESPFGWVFFYNSKRYVETGAFRDRLAGNGPVIVNKETSDVQFCGTDKSVQELIEDYERKLASNVA